MWNGATKFDPELPKAIPCKGYPTLVINILGVRLIFASVEVAEHFLEIISMKNMPTSIQLSNKRNTDYDPNNHWLSRLPGKIKPWSKREKIIPVIIEGIKGFKAVY